MKYLLLLTVSVSFLFACNNDKTESTSDTKSESKTETNAPDLDALDTASRQTPVSTNTSIESSGWRSSDENSFMRDCKSTAVPRVGEARATEYCDCMLQKLKARYSSYMEADRKLYNNETEMNRLASECNPRQINR
jgi:hypothetical protein